MELLPLWQLHCIFFFWLFVPSLVSNALKVWETDFCPSPFENPKNPWILSFSDIFRQQDWYFYLYLVSLEFSDLSYRSASKNSIFTRLFSFWQILLLFVFVSFTIVKCDTCRGGITADAISRLMLGPMDTGGTGEGWCVGIRTPKYSRTHDLPRFRALVRR